jgi:hypothetical protein
VALAGAGLWWLLHWSRYSLSAAVAAAVVVVLPVLPSLASSGVDRIIAGLPMPKLRQFKARYAGPLAAGIATVIMWQVAAWNWSHGPSWLWQVTPC